jgi:hypothetical protein
VHFPIVRPRVIQADYIQNMMSFFRTTCVLLFGVCHSTVLDMDANANLFSRMLPVFEQEEEELVATGKRPLLNGETHQSLVEAVSKVHKLMDTGVIEKEKGIRLLGSLEYAERVQKLASLLDGARLITPM